MEFALGIPNEHAESVYQVWESEWGRGTRRLDLRQVSMYFYYFSFELCFSIINIFHWQLGSQGPRLRQSKWRKKLTLISKQETKEGAAVLGMWGRHSYDNSASLGGIFTRKICKLSCNKNVQGPQAYLQI